jgi:ABC-type dipeptide/oligopeptide/nickel transport system permease subunit
MDQAWGSRPSVKGWFKKRGFWQDAIYRFSRNKLAVAGLITSVILVAITIFAPFIAPYPYEEQDYSAIGEAPSFSHPMGTDDLGRDVLSRVIYGGRVSISIGVLVQLAAVLIGLPLGALAGYYGGTADYIITRLVDIMMAFPSLMLAIIIMVVLGPGYGNVLFSMVIVSWPLVCRLARGQVLQLRESEFVLAARTIGASDRRIIFRHILPHLFGPVIVAVTLGIPATIFRESGLSFLGIGIVPPTPSWGQMVGEYYLQIQTYWHIPLFPAIALGLAILGFTFMGDGLQDALSPKGSD